jgi:hypothetical protein
VFLGLCGFRRVGFVAAFAALDYIAAEFAAGGLVTAQWFHLDSFELEFENSPFRGPVGGTSLKKPAPVPV